MSEEGTSVKSVTIPFHAIFMSAPNVVYELAIVAEGTDCEMA